MLVRYGTSPEGKVVKKAVIYTASDHQIDRKSIDADARRVVSRLKAAGFEAFIVGGAVRDLLIGRKPKDFDIATDASPKRISTIFSNSRIIGKRFRIVHLYFSRNRKSKIIEVSTFRTKPKGPANNSYGPMEEDVWRRDFTLNALFYCPMKEIIIDYVGGFTDIREKKIQALTSVKASFMEDPVRMVRGVRYAGLTGFRLSFAVTNGIKKHRKELSRCSPARVTEEVHKILSSGRTAAVLYSAYRLKLLEVILPAVDRFLRSGKHRQTERAFFETLGQLDARLAGTAHEKVERGELLSYLFKDLYRYRRRETGVEDPLLFTQQFLPQAAIPLLLSRRELAIAASILMKMSF